MDYSYYKNNEHLVHKQSELKVEINPFFKLVLKIGFLIFVILGLALTYLGELDFMIYNQTLMFIFVVAYFVFIPCSLFLLIFLAIKSSRYKSKCHRSQNRGL